MEKIKARLKAKKVREIEGWRGHAILWELDRPITTQDIRGDKQSVTTRYVITSSVITTVEETMVFAAREDGTPIHMVDLAGVIALDHTAALMHLAYMLERGPRGWDAVPDTVTVSTTITEH